MDHSLGTSNDSIYLPLVALGSGIDVIEKHITLDHSLEIEDHISGLSNDKFCDFVKIIRIMEKSLGNSKFIIGKNESLYKRKSGKVVVASKNLKRHNFKY